MTLPVKRADLPVYFADTLETLNTSIEKDAKGLVDAESPYKGRWMALQARLEGEEEQRSLLRAAAEEFGLSLDDETATNDSTPIAHPKARASNLEHSLPSLTEKLVEENRAARLEYLQLCIGYKGAAEQVARLARPQSLESIVFLKALLEGLAWKLRSLRSLPLPDVLRVSENALDNVRARVVDLQRHLHVLQSRQTEYGRLAEKHQTVLRLIAQTRSDIEKLNRNGRGVCK